jgi:prephenate dehydrogenase
MKLFNKVVVIGTGLIGGSMALDIKKKGLANCVVGISRRKISLDLAKKMGAIDSGSQDLSAVKDADLVIFATPPSAILASAPSVARLIKKDCIVIDVASTKEKIVSSLNRLFPNYVGTHPLAGSEKKGIKNASGGCFNDSLCLLTPVKGTHIEALKKISLLWKRLGAKTAVLDAATHDKILGFTSHLPHIAAFSLLKTVPASYIRFSSSGLRDTTRIASSDPVLWADIFLANRKNMLMAIGQLERNLTLIKNALRSRNRKRLVALLKSVRSRTSVYNPQ